MHSFKLLKTTLSLLFALAMLSSSAGNITVSPQSENRFTVRESTPLTLIVENQVSDITTLEIADGNDVFTRLMMAGYSRTQSIGSPEMPVLRKMIEVPVGASVRVEILNSSYTDIALGELGYLHTIFPAQPPVPKNGQVPDLILDAAAYSTNAFFPGELAKAETLGSLRSIHLGRLELFPVQYNPVTHTLRVYDRLEVRLTFTDGDLTATQERKAKYENAYFKSISRSVINYQHAGSRDTLASYPITYLIISDPMFEAQLQPFIEWKTKKGFHVIDAYTNQPNVGSTTYSIKSYIQGLYDNPPAGMEPPSFVLFVGDKEQVPAWTGTAGSHITDLYYCEYTGDDFPEIYYGRFSAQNTAQLQPQIDKTLMYEQFTMPDPSYLGNCVMIAGMDGTYGPTHGNGQILYGTNNYFNATNNLFSYTYLYPESGSNAAAIRQNISDGVCYANYTAHGSEYGWADPEFNVSQVAQMTNDGMYALLVGNCCLTSSYQVGECFGEALLRAEDKGSLGYIGASNNTYWDEDYYWGVGVGPISGNPPTYSQTSLGAYDRTFHTHGEPLDEYYTTMDQMVFAGNLAVTEGSPSSSTYYWEVYCLMGDPSLIVYYSVPPQMEVTYPQLMPLGSSSFVIETGEPYSYVALSFAGTLHGAMQADADGVAEMNLTPIMVPGMADIVVTAQNREPFIGTVLVANPEGPFILLQSSSTTELSGNGNNKSEGNEVIGLNIVLKNWGNTDGTDVTATITTSDPWVTLSDDSEEIGTVPAQSNLPVANAFSVILSPTVPDGHEVEFSLQVANGSREVWSSDFRILLSAPDVHCNSIAIDDIAGGNGNHRLDPGETASITYTFANHGGVMATDVTASLIAHSAFIDISDPLQPIGNIGLFGTKTVTFSLTVDSKAPEGISVDFEIALSSSNYIMNETDPIRIGFVCEDFETGDLSKFNWQTAGNLPWTITNLFPYEGTYSLRSGAITHNQTSEISLQYRSMSNDSISFYRKVSSESGDKLRFYIDNTMMGEWSGNTGGWKRASYPVTGGIHTFKWVYIKNNGGNLGSDAGWIDYISFPPPLASTLYAGADAMICSDDVYQAEAQATNYAAIQWSTSGTGSFDDTGILDPVYTPSDDDIAAGAVTLSMSMTDAQGAAFDDAVALELTQLPAVPAAPAGPSAVNLVSVYASDYTTQPVEGATSYAWTVEPEDAGMPVSRGETGTIVWNRKWAGTATIRVKAANTCGQTEPSEGYAVAVVNGTVGLTEPVADFTLSAFPNPARDVLTVMLSSQESGRISLRLVNLTGVTVYAAETTAGAGSIAIPVDHLTSGIYLLIASDGRDSRTVKIMVR